MKKTETKKPIGSRIDAYWKAFGPGLITGASDDDPSGIATYSQAGAGFGLATLWTAVLSFPLMAAVQEMCARMGAVTSKGLAGILKQHYHPSVTLLMVAFSFPAIVLNIGADLESMGAVAHMIMPGLPIYAAEMFFTAILMVCIIQFPYQKISSILKWLCLVLFLYIIIPFLVKVDWAKVALHTFLPTIRFDKDFLEILVAILGTTISPYLFFWQTTMEAEDILNSKTQVVVDKSFMNKMQADIYVGMFFSNLVMFFVILTTGVVLFNAGIHKIDSVEQAARALQPLAGNVTFLLFAIGIIGTGLLAIPVLAGSLSYTVAEAFNWSEGLEKKFTQAPGFYLTIVISLLAGLSLDFLDINPIKALLYTAVLYGLTAPVMIGIILHICNNEKVMGKATNGRWSNILGLVAFVLMTASAVALIYFQLS